MAAKNLVVGLRMKVTDILLSGRGISGNEFRFANGDPAATVAFNTRQADTLC